MKTLDQVEIGKSVRILRLIEQNGNTVLRNRMMEMGMTIGTEICVRRFAPLGNPMMIHLRGSDLSVRCEDAAYVEVEQPQ